MKKVLITDDVHPVMIEWLEQKKSFKVDFKPTITLEEVHEVIHEYFGLIVNSKILVDTVLIDKSTQLKFVARLGSGMEIIDKKYATEKGIAVFNSPEGNCDAVGEHALAMLLALNNKILVADDEVRAFDWQREKNRGVEIKGKTVGIVGFGHTGKAFAKKLMGFECRILAYDKYNPVDVAAFPWVTPVEAEIIQAEADIISFHLPLTKETQNLVNEDYLKACKNGVAIVNTSRGKVVVTQDLITELESGNVAGACLDVFENEKPVTFTMNEKGMYSRLYEMKNVVLTPHIAGWTMESKYKLSKILIDKIEYLLNQA